ncbi:hypothetical protein EDD93_3658 [Streptomyces sp. 840.1]|uniref:hypothetical protein n=1 Tax=Streptomyces sp. 840.1 TaxID=2485152 RepID=UPI000F462C2A|nr:hypothetical protein [Streptomyces sp. 840.1]ROQ69161.1 hypothetical protein EDD93_3658 [Streptomyces sp. 840.1]
MTDPTPELWTRDDIATHLGIAPGSVRRWISRHQVPRVDFVEVAGRPMARYRAADVRTAAASAPGRGARTDRPRA